MKSTPVDSGLLVDCEDLPLVEELSPPPDPEAAFLRFASREHCVFFDSARRERRLGRYSFLASDPFAFVQESGEQSGAVDRLRQAIAPFTVVICPVGADKSEAVVQTAQEVYQDLLNAGVDVILDDRGERPGAMFADWELIGVPHRVVLSDRGLKEGKVEYQHRRASEAKQMNLADVEQYLLDHIGKQ